MLDEPLALVFGRGLRDQDARATADAVIAVVVVQNLLQAKERQELPIECPRNIIASRRDLDVSNAVDFHVPVLR